MRLQLVEDLRALPCPVAEDASDRDLGVVVEDRPRHAAKEAEGLHVPVAERLLGLGRISRHEASIRMRQVECEEVDLALHPADDADRLAEVELTSAHRQRS